MQRPGVQWKAVCSGLGGRDDLPEDELSFASPPHPTSSAQFSLSDTEGEINPSLFLFWPHSAACGILVPKPGIEPAPPAVEAWSLNHWTAREVSFLPSFCVSFHTASQLGRKVNGFNTHFLSEGPESYHG